MTKFMHFLRDDAGAVTIDWVALTAGILLLGIMVVYAIFNNGVSSLVTNINSTLSGVTTSVTTGSVPSLNS
jgi:Flp pilus assembly pilin Flp